MKKSFLTMSILVTLGGLLGAVQTASADEMLKSAIAGKHRSQANAARDGFRHPYETLRVFGITPNMTVVELAPGGGWYTEILAPYLKDNGKLIAATFAADNPGQYQSRAYANFKSKLEANPAIYGKVSLGVFEPAVKMDYAPKNSVDLVLTFRNVHNWVDTGESGMKSIFKSAYDSLKPGGVFGVVEHRLPASKPQDDKASSGYVHESYVIALAKSVGFKLAGQSEINANPKDKAEQIVWALPPSFAYKDKDKEKYQAIGESDRMTLKFVKPE